MKYTIEFELPDNDTVLKEINTARIYWAVWGFNGYCKAIPKRNPGKWIDETFKPWGLVHYPYKCNQCGEHNEVDSKYCPNCGAKMEGVEQE